MADTLKRLVKTNALLMRHPDFALYGGVIMLGKTYLLAADQMPGGIPTAATDGKDVWYCEEFLSKLNDKGLASVVLHEALHKAFMHCHHYMNLDRDNPMLANQALDFFVNQVIKDMDPNSTITEPLKPETGAHWCQDDKYRGWAVQDIYKDLKQQQQSQKGKQNGSVSGGGFDGHMKDMASQMTEKEKEELKKLVDDALRQGQVAGNNASETAKKMLADMLEPKVNWRAVLREFVTSIAKGKDKTDWRRLNYRFVYEDIYLPSLVGERIGNIVVAIDTSGSIGEHEVQEFASELVDICEELMPEKVTVLWWDTAVHGQQVFDDSNYSQIRTMLKPLGGGGTDGSCVPPYIHKNQMKPDCVLMFTDGYLSPVSGFECPVLWFVNRAKDFVPSEGSMVPFDVDM